MAGQTHQIDIGDDDVLAPWPTVFDVVAATDVNEWVIVGGLMVQLHAYRAAIPPPRPTKDLDLVLDVAVHRGSFAGISAALSSIEFKPLVPDSKTSPLYRFQRNAEQVDLLVPDHLPRMVVPRFMMRPAFSVEAGSQAITRSDTFFVSSTRGSITVHAPDVLGALVAKGAAMRVDNRNPERHVEDAALLLASIESVGDMSLHSLNKNDRRRLAAIAQRLQNGRDVAWATISRANQQKGISNLERLIIAGGIDV
jgi:hypothetical protein